MLLSINPQHVEKILNGTKRFEFRKVRSRHDVRRIVIYSTSPVGQVVGEVEVVGTVDGPPSDVWEYTGAHSGISKQFFDDYYCGRQRAVAYELGAVSVYPRPKTLMELGIRAAPQSFVYV
ncbi:MAG: ASCH domain-containing protein [Thermoleophilia bacterium]